MGLGLIGYRGSGKTTVGRLLADRLGKSFADIDEQLVRQAGKTIKEIFEQSGEKAFRDLESQVIRDTVGLPDTIISFGGGAMDREENREAVKAAGCSLIYLRCHPAELLRRIRSDPKTAANRPNLTPLGGGIEEVQAVLDRREPFWRAMVSAEVDVTYLLPADVVERCLDKLRDDRH